MPRTPGPWRQDPDLTYEIQTAPNSPTPFECVAKIERKPDKREMEANARLIAAAPELLEALKAAAMALRSYQWGNASPDLAREIAEHADAAIAKAEGR